MKILFAGDYESQNSISWYNGLRESDASLEISLFKLPNKLFGVKLPYILSFILGFFLLKKKIFELKPDILIGYRTTSYGFLTALMNFKPLVIACQGETDLYDTFGINYKIKSSCKRFACKKAQLIHAWGENMVPSLLEHGAKREHILVLPRGIKVENFNIGSIKQKLDGEIGILSTRSLFPEYNLDKLINCVASNTKIRLHIVGSGIELNNLKELVIKLNLSGQVFFYGKLPNDEINSIAKKCLFYASFPKTEGMSTSLFEGLSLGLIPILNQIPANTIWVENRINGSIISDLNQTNFAEEVNYWIDPKNNEKRISAIESNRQKVELKLNISINMAKFVERYKELISINKYGN
jgi:glycosyltransferase involved in cell wall biosynthesis